MVLKINGDIVGNEWKEVYEWFGFECSTPGDVQRALAELPKGDRLQVKINSGGGEVLAGQEMYTMLYNRSDVDIEVESFAGSAASIIAMAGHCTISPVGMLMIHCVSVGGAAGNHKDIGAMCRKSSAVGMQPISLISAISSWRTGLIKRPDQKKHTSIRGR